MEMAIVAIGALLDSARNGFPLAAEALDGESASSATA
jgi:hypothetical protein